MTYDKQKHSEIVEPPITFALMCGLISMALLAILLLRAAQTTIIQVRDLANALSPFLTFLTVLVAVIGWGETARRNGEEARRTARIAGDEARKTETAKQEHARQGTRRQVRTLLWEVAMNIDECFYLHGAFKPEDVSLTSQRLIAQLGKRETAVDLSDTEFYAIDEFTKIFGRAVARAKRRLEPDFVLPSDDLILIEGDPRIPKDKLDISRQRRADHRHQYLLDIFRHTLPSLGKVVDLIGDSDLRNQWTIMGVRASETMESLEKRLFLGFNLSKRL